MGMALGAAVDLMDDAWWGPTTVVPGEARARMLVIEKGLPGSIFVNKRGERFLNEATPYNDICKQMYAHNTPESPSVPAYMIFDATYRRKYPLRAVLPRLAAARLGAPEAAEGGALPEEGRHARGARRASSGSTPRACKASVEKINRYAREGRDPDFHRGESLFDRYYGDEKVQPNPCLAPLDKPPYYGLVVYPGDLGTKGGLRTDASARVLAKDGAPIDGPVRDRQHLGVRHGPHVSRRRRHHGSGDDLRLHHRRGADRRLTPCRCASRPGS